jgi:hypothetical protein
MEVGKGDLLVPHNMGKGMAQSITLGNQRVPCWVLVIAPCYPTNSLTGVIAGRGRGSKAVMESLLGNLSVCLKD